MTILRLITNGLKNGEWWPGVTFTQLQDATKYSESTLTTHLNALVADGLIELKKYPGTKFRPYVIVDEKNAEIQKIIREKV